MCKYLLLLVIVVFCSPLSANDKVFHFTISGMLGSGADYVLYNYTDLNRGERLILSTTLATIPGLAKEIIDDRQKGNKFSKSDLAYDVAGAFFGALVSSYFHNSVSMRVEEKEASISWTNSF